MQATQSVLTVGRVGRDPVMRFAVGDWVEVTDDHRELHEEPGEMAKIEDVDEATRQITLDRQIPLPPLPITIPRPFGATRDELAARHTKLIRWDQRAPPNALDGDGLMTIPTGVKIALEEGITLTFSIDAASTNGRFHNGDYWVFAARTADGSVEELDEEPPRGVHHDYAPLAVLDAPGPAVGGISVVSDCRVRWPPEVGAGEAECCCSVVVDRGEDIQEAINKVCAKRGGCVCLKGGEHRIVRPIQITCSDVRLVGNSSATVISAAGVVPLLEIRGENLSIGRVVVEGIGFQLQGGEVPAEPGDDPARSWSATPTKSLCGSLNSSIRSTV